MGGDPDTVWQTSRIPTPENEYTVVGPAMRIVFDMDNLDRSRMILAGGISGHAASPFYDDQIQMWHQGEMRSAPWSRTAIESQTAFVQRLEPLR